LSNEFLHGLIFNSLYPQVRSHYLLHAAALTFQKKGILLIAESGYGKTTLALALVKQGFQFLSDEIGALGLKDGLIYPFPRGLHIRKASLNILDIPLPWDKALNWFGKYLIDIDDLFPGMIGEPSKISYVFILRNLHDFKSDKSDHHHFKAIVSHITPAFLKDLKDNPEISTVCVTEQQAYPLLTIQANHKLNAIYSFEELSNQHGIMILDLIKREEDVPDFSSAVQYQKITKSQAAVELLRHFIGGHKTNLLKSETDQNPTMLLFKLASLIKNTDCYQISVGPLEQMVDVISNLLGKDMLDRSPSMGDI
jgi:hypothetical protein